MPIKDAETVVLYAKDFHSRDALEKEVGTTHGETPDEKNVTIEGTKEELLALKLSHGDRVWGVVAIESDYQEVIVPTVERGELFPSKLNGIQIK